MEEHKLTVAMSAMAKKAVEDPGCIQASACATTLLAMKAPPKSEAELAGMIDAAKIVRLARLALERSVAQITDPLNAALRAVREQSNGRIGELKAAEGRAKDMKTQWDDGVERERRRKIAEQQRAEEAAQVPGDVAAPVPSAFVPPAPNKVAGGIGAMHGRMLPKVRMTDKALAIKHNPQLFDLNERAALRLLQEAGVIPVPGLELYYERSQVLS